eukprot:TRINITY_DN5759_c0_g1_i2.p1 TRINITY_DN5759_c0_g1~~TRINITY_DN5759_c0_g1_i2.p1  ORF type:complete len:377 (+),score=65.70 TRINITY_DN5759_c0_g1_i2:121-1131(+)
MKKHVDTVMEEAGVLDKDHRIYAKCDEVDLVYTWVNGSDPLHVNKRIVRSGGAMQSAGSINRFRDMGGLKYSLRSAEKHAPWLRKIWIVTDDQVPDFLDTKNKKVQVISHREMFKDKTALPTFNSNAIEANFFNLPSEVAECFIFLNDDMLFMNDVTRDDFWQPQYGQVMYASSWTAPPSKDKLSNSWHRAIKRGNELFDELWNEKGVRHYASHGPYFFMRPSLSSLYKELQDEFDATSARPFRTENDLTLPFMYQHHTLRYYQAFVASSGINYFAKIVDDLSHTKKALEKAMSLRPKTACLNDALSNERPNQKTLTWVEENFFQKLFPEKPKHEL